MLCFLIAVIVVYLGRIVMQMRLIAIQTLLNFGVMTDTIADTHGPSVTKNPNPNPNPNPSGVSRVQS